jgi:RNA polymerase sigma-70 factor (ECF subfamily)
VLTGQQTATLVAAARRGDAAAFSALVAAHLRAAYFAALAIVGQPSDAEDVAQDAFLTAFERLETCREPERFSGWLLRIVRNRALNWLEHRRVRERKVETEPGPAPVGPEVEDPDLRDTLLAALAQLTPAQREVLLLHELEGWSHAEIAVATDGSEVMSRQHLIAARRKLRACLADVAMPEVHHGR